jgi:hypothetical protein
MRHANALERGFGALLALGGFHPAIGERQLDVLEHREIANQVEALEDETDFAVAHARPFRRRQFGDRPAVQQVLAFARRIEQAENRRSADLPQPDGPARHIFAPGDACDPDSAWFDLVGEEHLRRTIKR